MCGCGSTNSNGSSKKLSAPNKLANVEKIATCDITKQNLITWKSLLSCIKANNYYKESKTNEFTVNRFLGIVQSGLNYPADYCYFYEQLNYFKTFILPNILENVPHCINQQ